MAEDAVDLSDDGANSGATHSVLQLAGVTVDRDRCEFRGESRSTKVRRKVVDALDILAQNEGRVMSREALLENLWPNRIASDESLTQLMSELRRKLIEVGAFRDVISTVPKKGYELTCEVNWGNDQGAMSLEDAQVSEAKAAKLPLWAKLLFVALSILIANALLQHALRLSGH